MNNFYLRGIVTLLFVATISHAQSLPIDPVLVSQIAAIPAIDNHAHPLLSPPAYATGRNFDDFATVDQILGRQLLSCFRHGNSRFDSDPERV
jgi:hypothetical protein